MCVSGACECGSVAYTIEASPVHVYACHCMNCQTRSGSAFAQHAMIQTMGLEIVGATEEFKRSSGGIESTEVFCASCHTRLFNQNSMIPGMTIIRAGTLDNSHELEPIAHIWTSRKQPWIVLPEHVPAFEHSPTPEEFGAAIALVEDGSRRR